MKNFITKIIGKIGIDKITHFFVGATIALSVKVSYDEVLPEDGNYEGGIQGFLPLDGRPWHTYLPIPWLWDRLYHRPHTFNADKFTFVDFL